MKAARKHVPTSPSVKHDMDSLFDHESILEWQKPRLLSGERTLSSGGRCIARWDGERLFDVQLEGAYDGIEISLYEGAIRNKQTGDVLACIHDPKKLPMLVSLSESGGFKNYVIIEVSDDLQEKVFGTRNEMIFVFYDAAGKPLAVTNSETLQWPIPRVAFRMIDRSPTAPSAGLIALILNLVANAHSVIA